MKTGMRVPECMVVTKLLDMIAEIQMLNQDKYDFLVILVEIL